jgi:hypothetical protein
MLTNQFKTGFNVGADTILRAKMDLEVADAQVRAAMAEERAAAATEIAANASIKNARYMLWSVVAAAVSAVGSLGAAIVAFAHR